MSVKKLLLTRGGTFHVGEAVDDTAQCGPRGTRDIRYHVSIVGDPSRLVDGMLIEHNRIQKYFDRAYDRVDVLPTCEVIAMKACEEIAHLVGCPVEVEVTVGGTPPAGLTAFWTPEGTGLGCLWPKADASLPPYKFPHGDVPDEVQQLASDEVIDTLSPAARALGRLMYDPNI